MIKNLIFDVDGTILDTEMSLLKSLQKVLKEEGMEYELDKLTFVLGIPGIEALKQLNVVDIDRIHSKWSQEALKFSHEVSVFKGVEKAIKELADKENKLGIVTSKTQQQIVDGFNPYGLAGYFDYTVSADDTKKNKPHPAPLLKCLDGLDIKPHEAIYIGDSIYDMQSAKAAGIEFALAFWGAKSTDQFLEANYILETPEDILKLID